MGQQSHLSNWHSVKHFLQTFRIAFNESQEQIEQIFAWLSTNHKNKLNKFSHGFQRSTRTNLTNFNAKSFTHQKSWSQEKWLFARPEN